MKESEKRICQNCHNEFTIEPDDFVFYEKMKVSTPTFCPDCRFQRRLSFRNNRVFYKRECALCGEKLLTIYNPDRPYTIYCRDCWLSDKWNPTDYGREYDFSIPFFSQFRSLQTKVPRINLYRYNFIESEYCNYGLDFKECYLMFGGHSNERVYFGNQVFDSRDTLDVAFSEKIELGYENFECARTNKLLFGSFCMDCMDSRYLVECRNCMSCFGCVGLTNKQYYIYNQPRTKEEYEKFILSSNFASYKAHTEFLKKVEELRMAVPHRYARIYKSINSDGDDLYEVKNVHNSFSSRQSENSKYLFFIRNNAKECYDNSFQGFNSELLYEIAHGFSGSNTAFGIRNLYNQDSRYNEECQNCQSIFGCEGLRKKNYCILNKQYSKEEYETLILKIIKHMEEMPYIDKNGRVYKYGDFFPSDLAPFAYNESIAQEYYPLSKEQALEHGYLWKEIEERNYNITMRNENIPDDIKTVGDDFVNQMIECGHQGKCLEQCTEAFRVTSHELEFYRRMSLPLPRFCPNCRHYQRINLRNPLKLWHRKCMREGCQNEFETSYAPERPEIIYCESCYQQEVV
ncbi:MAG: hypothetical protein A2358_02705 [Candidatus Staskawiczbacteria bacterium RIFOXYB1_FULL_37_44]|uniref:Zinc-binding domain-containing protein n=1 Tax=Candidatus Staskawiczbacteria bacterium RIFOXYB1_FULL_37_44 TaxID=1802223 RepID=A0A1G2IWJ7_9BACT|nr:MAG: hypothetical protein A2358_02705 [Candidatus Staskawiczbacteria bacterium RIFOXYB1_FULL_37_44]OGZ83837.1 MAG: hypothetical protein A2416_02420 [Candidatus Staskawiczbacteria bacterium RIFOXYC1_FULL_37_52]OGZ88022.1 MAG: hypothetical protein A2444_00630 [Candidatus Staskawiczbacteria bacterium RIFOXYC2_FULL_37_19]